MTAGKIQELADQVVRELRREGRIFTVDHIRKEEDLWEIAYSHRKTLRKVVIDVEMHNTENTVYTECGDNLWARQR